LLDKIKALEKEVSAHKKEIKARDSSIAEKDRKISELRKKNQELDKFKFVLDFKIRELKHQIEPRQLEITGKFNLSAHYSANRIAFEGMRDQIKKMDEELEKYHKSNAHLDELIGVLREKITQLQEESKLKRVHANHQESAIARFRSDLQLR
jgi:chromosome segregation ATPase